MRPLAAKDLVNLRKQEFEEFCWQLLTEEYKRCFEPDTVEFPSGPSPEDVPDGGRDLEAVVLQPPSRRGHFSLLPRQPGSIRFSCKTHKDEHGRGWKKQVRDDIDKPRVIDGHTGKLAEDATERASKGPPPPRGLLEMLAGGGSYWILLNVEGDRLDDFKREAAERLSFWIDHVLHEKVDLTGHIEVKDASFLAEVFKERSFALSLEQSRRLELDEPDFLRSWEQWSEEMAATRRRMSFVVDAGRKQLIDDLGRVLADSSAPASEPRFFRLTGPPGAGKTRLVHHVLEQQADLRARVRYTKDAEEAREWISRGGMARSTDLMLVVDEVPPDVAPELWRSFERRARSGARARLVMVGPQDDASDAKPRPSDLRPLERPQIEILVKHELEQEDELADVDTKKLIETVTRLSEGYPLFAMWLTRALARDPDLLDEPSSDLTDGDDPWLATAAVLVGPRPALAMERDAWKAEAELRAKALLLVVLVPEGTWSIPVERQDALVGALEVESWPKLRDAATRCKDRGLLREEPTDHHYISPANLERLVLNHLFGPRGVDPEPLRRAVPKGFERLLQRAARVKIAKACRERLAQGVLDGLEPSARGGEPRLGLLGLAAHLAPESAAFAVARLVERVGAGIIMADEPLWETTRRALAHLARRRVSARAFESIEEALFSLASEQPRPEPWRGNARATWASLFQAVGHQTHRGFEERAQLLRRRLESEDPRLRQLALDGVVRLMVGDADGYHPGWDDVDGEWEEAPTDREILERQRLGWRWLAELTEDPDPGVHSRARGLIAEHFQHGARRSGLDAVLDQLPAQAKQWTPTERNALRDAVEWVLDQRLHGDPPVSPGLIDRLADLRRALQPTDLQERLLSQVGQGRPGQLSLVGAARIRHEREDDRALARELLAHLEVLAANLAWLTSEDAVRARVFGHALGTVDEAQALLPMLEAAIDEHPVDTLLVSYLCGWADRAGPTALDPWLVAHADETRLTGVVARTIVAIGGSNARAQLLVSLVARGGLEARHLLGLGFWSWHEGVDLPALDALIAALARSTEQFCQIEALGLMARRLERSPAVVEPEIAGLARALLRTTSSEQLSAVAERDWIGVAIGLHAHGDIAVMSAVLAIVVEQGGYLAHARAVLDHWLDESAADVWRVLVHDFSTLEGRPASILGHFASELHLVERAPPQEVLDWIGDDEAMALKVAEWSAPHGDDVEPVTRELLVRFGADGKVAATLFAAAMARPARSSHDEFEAEQLDRASRWVEDPQPEVAAWARRLRDTLAERREQRRTRGYA